MALCKLLANVDDDHHMLCREDYQKAGMKQLQTDECVFTRYVSNIIGQPSLTNEDLLINGKFLNMEIVPVHMRVYRSCCHPVAAMIRVMYCRLLSRYGGTCTVLADDQY